MEHGVGTTAPAWAAALEHGAVGQALRDSMWLYPAVEVLHIVGFALLVGAIAAFDLRVARAGPRLELGSWQRAVLPVARAGFALAVPMGLLLFSAEAGAYLGNPAFLLKMGLISAAVLNVLLFHALARRRRAAVGPLRLLAGLSLGLWLAVLICGRMIAYV
jgi:hypothetical protein